MLAPPLQIALDQFAAEQAAFAKWFFLVNPSPRSLAVQAEHIQREFAWTRVSIGACLAPQLAPLTPRERTRQTARLLQACIVASATPVVCGDCDILFAPSLRLDPLTLFEHISRRTPILLLWPGTFADGVLRYAVPEHASYRTWPIPPLLFPRIHVV